MGFGLDWKIERQQSKRQDSNYNYYFEENRLWTEEQHDVIIGIDYFSSYLSETYSLYSHTAWPFLLYWTSAPIKAKLNLIKLVLADTIMWGSGLWLT